MNQRPGRVKPPAELNQDPLRLRRRRIAAGLSLRQAGEKSGCHFTHISALENGNHTATAATLAKLAGAYGCEIADLMPREPARRPPAAPPASNAA